VNRLLAIHQAVEHHGPVILAWLAWLLTVAWVVLRGHGERVHQFLAVERGRGRITLRPIGLVIPLDDQPSCIGASVVTRAILSTQVGLQRSTKQHYYERNYRISGSWV